MVLRIMMRLRGNLSAIHPENIAILMKAMASESPIRPKERGSWVMLYTCHATITACIWVARVMRTLPAKKNLKLRFFKTICAWWSENSFNVCFFAKVRIRLRWWEELGIWGFGREGGLGGKGDWVNEMDLQGWHWGLRCLHLGDQRLYYW